MSSVIDREKNKGGDYNDTIPEFCSEIGSGNPTEMKLMDKAIVKVMTVH